jgi:hypothetical protein
MTNGLIEQVRELLPKVTKGEWEYTTVDYCWNEGFIQGEGHPFDAIWSFSENKSVCVAQDASSYAASFDFRNTPDADLIIIAPQIAEALLSQHAELTAAREEIARLRQVIKDIQHRARIEQRCIQEIDAGVRSYATAKMHDIHEMAKQALGESHD